MSRHRSPAGRPAPLPGPVPARAPARVAAPVAPLPVSGVLSPADWESQHALHVPPAGWSGPRIAARERGGRTRARARHAAAPAVHNGLAGAAATGAVLAVVVPALGSSALASPLGGALALPDAAAPGERSVTIAAAGVAGPAPALAADEPQRFLLASLTPVPTGTADLPAGADVAGLVKSAGLVEAARAAEEVRLAREAQADCDADLDGLGRVKPWVRDAARFLSCLYDQPDLIGVAGRARVSDHPRGLAVDLMTRGERGDRIAECALANQDALGIAYVIWEQRVNYGDGWERMSDRGSDTENHMDHVHVSFERGAGDGTPLAELCS